MRTDEDLSLIADIDASVKAAMEALGSELMNYLKEAGEQHLPDTPVEQPKQRPKQTIFNEFKSMFRTGPGKAKVKSKPKPKKIPSVKDKANKSAAGSHAHQMMWTCYKNYKNAHRMLTW